MLSTAITQQLCLPITALGTVVVDSHQLLLVGQGPFLHVYNVEYNYRLLTSRIFDSQAIHGVFPGETQSSNNGTSSLQLLLFGGSSLAVASVRIRSGQCGSAVCQCSAVVIQASDWILRVTNHNFGKGNSQFVLLTTNDHLFKVDHLRGTSSNPEIVLLGQGPKSTLYSGDICSHKHEALLVAAGSVFGEVLIWSCTRTGVGWESYTTHRFAGHQGSVFGIRISNQFFNAGRPIQVVASCSDDRTIRVWDVSDHESIQERLPELQYTVETGFGHRTVGSSSSSAPVTGHVSRVWDVDFLISAPSPKSQQIHSHLISRGEDATCQVWSLDITRRDTTPTNLASLKFVSADHLHFGKNVLSWTLYSDSHLQCLASGGADGRIITRPLQLCQNAWDVSYSTHFEDIPLKRKVKSLKEYLVVDTGTIAAISASGHLLRCTVPKYMDPTWSQDAVSILGFATKLCSNSLERVVVAATKAGLLLVLSQHRSILVDLEFKQPVSWMRLLEVTTRPNQCHRLLLIVTFPDPRLAALVRIELADLDSDQHMTRLHLPTISTITASCYHQPSGLLFIGFRDGSLSMVSESAIYLCSSERVHGSDAVTSLQMIDSSSHGKVHLLSTGRDGTFAIHKVKFSVSSSEYSFETLYTSSPQVGINLEGAALSSPSESDLSELILFGWRSREFVVWNHTKQIQISSVDCGGGHRSWAYDISTDMPTSMHLSGRKQALSTSFRNSISTPSTVREGGHGREIKAVAVKPDAPGQIPQRIIATGAEDTTIRLFSDTRHQKHRSLTLSWRGRN